MIRHEPTGADGDTIVALSTPPGVGALAVIRLSGPGAVPVAERLFRGRIRLRDAPARTAQLGMALGPDGAPVDQVLATVLIAPRSYTGEDMVEFSGHGGVLASRLLIEAAVVAGARPAHPGEFTRRAFQNGRIDLVQAEAVAELIHARGERALRNALAQLGGGLSSRLAPIRSQLLDRLVPMEAFIDFGEDVPEPPGLDQLRAGLEEPCRSIRTLLAGDRRGRLLSEGATVVLAGKPNVGKSSLMNALAGRERAIVHHVPGTTRDTIEVPLAVNGLALTLVDTAGLRSTPDPVEEAGVERARQSIEAAHLVFLVVDGSAAPDQDDISVAPLLEGREYLVVVNKTDLPGDRAMRAWCAGLGRPVVEVSARTGAGIAELISIAAARMEELAGSAEDVTMTRARHYDALSRALAALERASGAAAHGAWAEMIAADLREALGSIDEITGESAGADILDRIFTTFCIGK